MSEQLGSRGKTCPIRRKKVSDKMVPIRSTHSAPLDAQSVS